MTEQTHHHHSGAHTHHHEDGMADLLDLDARILGTYLAEATEWAAGLGPEDPGTIFDVGAGSGVGTLALARQFPEAEVFALDKSKDMLARTVEAAKGQGLSARVHPVQADLDESWPALDNAGLIWASSALHELADPERAMHQMFAALRPGGLLMVVEMDGLPRFLSDGFGGGLETRLHAALAEQGWNSHPDWQPALERAGFIAVEQRAFPTQGCPTPELAARYARGFLGRMGPSLAGTASTEDLNMLACLLADNGPTSVLHSPELQVRGSRTAWAARRP